MSVLFVQRISIHHSRSDIDEKSLRAALKADYGYDGRRLSRFTLNALTSRLAVKAGSPLTRERRVSRRALQLAGQVRQYARHACRRRHAQAV